MNTCGFLSRGNQSEHEAGKTSSVVLRMSEIYVNILRAKRLNRRGCRCPNIQDARACASSEKFKCCPKW
jgi:hypothetical protein